jgi:ABC-2 type transport system ATP-binding protein
MSDTHQDDTRVAGPGGREVLEVRGVRKSYGATLAVDGIDLTVSAGEIRALIGPNGAGKTTLVSLVAGLLRPDAGTVHIGGIDVARSPRAARRLLGLAPQETGVYLPLTVRQNIEFFGRIAGLRRAPARARTEEIAAALGLEALLDRRASELSGGERRRVHTAMALVHRPTLALLDEPTTGADVRTRAQILQLVRELSSNGTAIVYSSHYLREIEELGAAVTVVDHGRVVAHGEQAELLARFGAPDLEALFLDLTGHTAEAGIPEMVA